MTEQVKWIYQFNKKCADFLEWESDSKLVSVKKEHLKIVDRLVYSLDDLKFHSDWNWIMVVVEHIVELPKTHNETFWKLNGKVFNIKHMAFHEIIGNKKTLTKRIEQFIDWYNENKK